MDNEMTPRKRSLRGGKWLCVHNCIFDLECGKGKPYLITVYSHLCMMANRADETCYPSQIRIAKESGMSIRKVKDAIRELSIRRIIFIERKHYRNKTRNKYLLTDPSLWILHSAPNALRSVRHIHPNKNQENKKKFIMQQHVDIQSKMADLTRKMSINRRSNAP